MNGQEIEYVLAHEIMKMYSLLTPVKYMIFQRQVLKWDCLQQVQASSQQLKTLKNIHCQ